MKVSKGENSRISKSHNRGIVLRLIATREATTRIDLAKKTGLVKMTLSNIVGEFIERGLIEETSPVLRDSLGRNPIDLRISDKAPKIIGVSIARKRIQVVLSTIDLRIVKEKTVEFDSLTSETMLKYIFGLVDEIKANEPNILGIGVTCAGPMDMEKGMVLSPPDFYGIENIPLRDIILKQYDCPVFVEHDHNAAALAEHLFGAGKDVSDLIYLGLGTTGISSGIILGGELISNTNHYEPEIGHVTIDKNGINCSCGRKGCLEPYAKGAVICASLKKATNKDLSFKEYCEMYETPQVDCILSELADNIACALTSVVNIMHPVLIILGRGGVYLPKKYIEYIENYINCNKFVKDNKKIAVLSAHFDDTNRAIGAVCGVLVKAFGGELLF